MTQFSPDCSPKSSNVSFEVTGEVSRERSNQRCDLEVPVGSNQPTDANLPKVFFLYAGIVGLLGWNTTLTFMRSFDSVVFGGMTWGGSGWPIYCALSYSLSTNVFAGLFASRAIASKLSSTFRCYFSAVVGAVAMIGLLAVRFLAPQHTPGGKAEDDSSTLVLGIAMFCVLLVALSSAGWQSATFGMAGAIDPNLMQTLMIGQGVAGILSGAVGFAAGESPMALFLSFVVAALVIAGGIPYFVIVSRTNPCMRELLTAPRSDQNLPTEVPQRSSTPATSLVPQSAERQGDLPVSRSSLSILRESAWPQALTVCFVFMVTFIVFPGVLARWMPGEHVTLLIATYQLFDVIGRSAPEIDFMKVRKGTTVSILAGLRIVFVPLFILVQRSSSEVWGRSSFLQFTLMVLFAFSNGYVSTLSMTLGPSQQGVAEDEKEAVGTMMSFFLCLGILLGSLLALLTQIGVAGATPESDSPAQFEATVRAAASSGVVPLWF